MHSVRTKILSAAVLAGLVSAAFATDARIEAMGKSSKFIMDDISIFDNPANIGIYPNYLVGELGTIQDKNFGAGSANVDPSPWFGGIFSLPLGGEDSRDPRLNIAGAFNRVDSWSRLLPDKVILSTSQGDSLVPVPDLTTNFDGFLGGSTPGGNLYAAHIYIGMQDGAIPQQDYETNSLAFASIFKFDLGVNWQMGEDVDWEVSGGLGRVAYGESDKGIFDGDYSWWAKSRLFSTIEALNGELVPEAEIYNVQAGNGLTDFHVGAGLGVNVAMDRGFFWLGIEGFRHSTETEGFSVADDGSVVYDATAKNLSGSDVATTTGGVLSFGIERNVFWDWFVVRVGGRKVIAYVDCDEADGYGKDAEGNALAYCGGKMKAEGNYWETNPVGDGSLEDHIGWGWGINVEEKLKIDVVMAEDFLYRNPFQGGRLWISRVSASYSF